MGLTKMTAQDMFKLLSVISFHNMCIVKCDFLVVKVNAMFCFLNGFGIAVPVFSFKKQQIRS